MVPEPPNQLVDVAVIGAGAAGLATAIFTARHMPGWSIVALDGAQKLGAKILVSGGGRCNVTNRVVTAADFCGTSPNVIRRVLAAFTVEQTVAFFREIGVELHEEEHGKLFPDTERARTVLDALVHEADRRGVRLLTGQRVTDLERGAAGFHIVTGGDAGTLTARRVVLATGGLSLPKTGSDGGGYQLARQLGHALVPPTPALVPFVLEGDWHAALSGIAHDVELTVRATGRKPVRVRGALLWTHFGVSGPAVLDVSRHWHRARVEQRPVTITANLLPGDDFTSAERKLLELASSQPKTGLRHALASWLPARVADAVLGALGFGGTVPLAHLGRDLRRKLIHALVEWPLPVRDSRGYAYAEVTAGGVPLNETDPRSMASRRCPNLYLVGEILDVDGRIGGFNFQWAWSSAWVAATGVARKHVGD
ncbi:MAG: NAD(P)/FAD-dependent oxidoreductase [Planctomycetota bacterium]